MNRNPTWLFSTVVATSGPLAVILVRLLGSGVGSAAAEQAAVHPEALAPDLTERVRATPEQLRGWQQAEAVLSRPLPPREPASTTPPIPVTETPTGTRPVPTPRLTLSAVLGGGERGAAVLNERIYWIGADLGDGWTLRSVDSVARTVTLRHESGVEHRISLDTNG